MLLRDLPVGAKFRWDAGIYRPDCIGVKTERGWNYPGEYERTSGLQDRDPVILVSEPLVRVSIDSVPLGTLVSLDAIGPVKHPVVCVTYKSRGVVEDNYVRTEEYVYIPAVPRPLKEFKVGDKVSIGGTEATILSTHVVQTCRGTYSPDTLATAVS